MRVIPLTGEPNGKSLRLSIGDLESIAAAEGHWSLVGSIVDPGHPGAAFSPALGFHDMQVFRFHDVIDVIDGYTPPPEADIVRWISSVSAVKETPDPSILVHCHLGISRSVAAAAIAIAVLAPDRIEEIPETLTGLRDKPWPNRLMAEMADDRLGCGGRLYDACLETRIATAHRHPEWTERLTETHRSPEVDEVRKVTQERAGAAL